MKQTLSVEVLFDFICPWCLIGQRQLQAALLLLQREQPQIQVELQWRGVQLLPGLPANGLPFHAFYVQRLGSEQAVRERQAQVRAAASVVGEDIDFTRIRRMPNTANAHRLLQRASSLLGAAQLEAMLAQMFIAYFHQGRDLGDSRVLLAIAQSCGLEAAQVADCLRDDGSPFLDGAGRAGSAVPRFRFNEGRLIAGAQPAEVLLAAMLEALHVQVPA
ncbi:MULTISPECIES: DsbA family protein [unclassified Pseudomonas]|uniref:DsbA family protein n=1 Tax=unclassified Pseudomonas TaxID=196821 RepID=UPI000480857E|nr:MULTISPECIES: DsbA family protein [unclassified Pseudomonas]RAS22719.1 putative DsbA family dithiol-disulfide isomerase [Pseudomonas sp. URMO17WK12:I7]SMF68136.1 Predicted dithiol-disulfide isomerase, DsbA family [Pseudomonas sp. URMO17WK12:I5]